MGKRRVAAGSDRRRGGVELSTRKDLTPESASSKSNHDRKLLTIFVVIFFIVSPFISLIVYRTRYASPTDASLPHVHQPDFVKTDINYLEVLTENSKVSENTSHRHFTNAVLAYITPWNSRGYEIAKSFNSKFTHLSPVWYDLKSQGPNLILEGRRNVDKGWISDLRMKGNAQVQLINVVTGGTSQIYFFPTLWDYRYLLIEDDY